MFAGPLIGPRVSTHSRAEAAATHQKTTPQAMPVSTHSRAEAAAHDRLKAELWDAVSTHSRAEAAAIDGENYAETLYSFNTQPRGGGCYASEFGSTWN